MQWGMIPRFSPLHCGISVLPLSACPLCAKSGHSHCSKQLRYSITSSAGDKELVWHGEAEHRGGLDIEDQLELGRLHNGQVRDLRPLEDAPGIGAGLTPRVRNVGSVAHQPTGFGKITRGI